MTEKNAPTSLAISMAMRIRWYGTERIFQYGRPRATPDATGSMVIDFGVKIELWHCEIAF